VIRQRVNLRHPPWGLLTRLLTIVFAIVLIYGGAMVALLALKFTPGDIDRISGYRTGYHWLAGLTRADFSTAVSLIAGFGGLLLFLVFAALTLQALPRPYLTRSEVGLPEPAERGATIVRPRAMERIAEVAAQGNLHVMGVTGRLGDGELNVDVGLDTVPGLAQTLEDVRRRVREQLEHHQIPPVPVNVTLTGYERPTRRDPS
jgi:hypothetical protein